MNLQNNSKINTDTQITSPSKFAEKLSAPIIAATVLIFSISYISHTALSQSITGIGETSVVSRFLYNSGNLLNKLIYPLISGTIAYAIGGFGAISAGLLGGMLSGTGATFTSANSNTTSISGIFGCLLMGYFAGYCKVISDKFFKNTKNVSETFSIFLTPGISVIITFFAVLAINTASFYINHFCAILLGITGKINGVLLCVILGIFMSADNGGPMFLAGYIFSVASISTGEAKYMAAVLAAGAIPPLTMSLYTLIYKERTDKHEQFLGVIGAVGGLLGIPQCALAFYITKTYRFVLSCIPGGIAASILSYLFNCSSNTPYGGILGLSEFRNLLFFLLALSVGVLISTFILSLTESAKQNTSAKSKDEQPEITKVLSAQI